MSNKCLVTRLKAAIQNDDLPLFDTIKLQATERSSSTANVFRLGLKTTRESVTVRVDGDGYFADSYANLSDQTKRMTETTVNTSSYKYLYFKSGAYNVFLQNAHNIYALNVEGPTITSHNFFRLGLTELKNNPGITVLQAGQSNVYGNIGDIPSTITDLMLQTTSSVVGNIKDIAYKCIFSERLWIKSSGITGSVEDFVAGQVSQGVDTYTSRLFGNFSSIMTGQNLTFGGTTPAINFNYFSWSGTSRIIAADVIPIENATTIYAKGATSEEISAWEAAGKTVVVITDDAGE